MTFRLCPHNLGRHRRHLSRGSEGLYGSDCDQAIARCILMTTDPGDLVLDPTCGSGTTAYVAEQWGRRWITTDTSRIALNIAKTRLMTAIFPFYPLRHRGGDRAVVKEGNGKHELKTGTSTAARPQRALRLRLQKGATHHPGRHRQQRTAPTKKRSTTSRSKTKSGCAWPGHSPSRRCKTTSPSRPRNSPASANDVEDLAAFEDLIFEHLKSAGVKTGDKSEQAVFTRIDRLSSTALHAEGFTRRPPARRKHTCTSARNSAR